ncbi:hypothetical protein [Wolbachia endosymbiont (group B) of Eupithecia inturbata]|uniref:hypothetical protein n=1 Tax=Wolbachia endosymbiont (group B) of Eupithecia inturbata TaxID=3139316 RepID=UPI003CCA8A9B
MGQYTFKVDGKDPLYKKLIKLPTAYYRLKQDNNSYNLSCGLANEVKLRNAGLFRLHGI